MKPVLVLVATLVLALPFTGALAETNSTPGEYVCTVNPGTSHAYVINAWPANWDMSQARADAFCHMVSSGVTK